MIERWRRFYKSPADDCTKALLEAAQSATTSIHVCIYGLTLYPLADILIEKHKEGLTVGVVADHTQAEGREEKPVLQKMVDAGVPVTISASPTGAINHQKSLLVDQQLGALHNQSCAVYGSWNFSTSAEKEENLLVVDNDPSICDFLFAQYQEVEVYGKQHPQWQLIASAPIQSPNSIT